MAKKTPEEILEEARKLIGKETPPVPSRYPVEHDPIRRYCHMVGDDNPLFLDPEYGKKTKYGATIAPMFYIRNMSGPGAWPPVAASASVLEGIPTPGDRNVNLNTETEFKKPIKVGERITKFQRLVDVYIKPVRLDPKSFWLVYDTIYQNEQGEVVVVDRNTLMRHRSPDQLAADGDA